MLYRKTSAHLYDYVTGTYTDRRGVYIMSPFSIGQKIRELRKGKRMTQIDLAKGLCTPSMISQIESDRAKPSYKVLAKIADRLEVPVDRLLSDKDVNLEALCTYKLARALMASQEYEAAAPLFQELLAHARVYVSSLEVRLELAQCYIMLGRCEEAEPLLRHVEEYADFQYDFELLSLSYKLSGLLELRRKRFQMAVYRLQQAIKEFNRIEVLNPFAKADLLFHLGLAHAGLRQTEQALDCYRQAAELYGGHESFVQMARLYLQISESHRELRELELAAEYATRASALYEALQAQYLRVRVQSQGAMLFGQAGRLEEAVEVLEAALPQLQRLERKEAVGLTYIDLARLHLQGDAPNRAEECALLAQAILPEEHAEQGHVCLVLGQAARMHKQYEAAAQYLQQAGKRFEEVGAYADWETAMSELSQLYGEQQDYRMAFVVSQEIREVRLHLLAEKGVVL